MMRPRRKIIFLLAVIFLSSGCHFFWKRYHNVKHKFSILLPRSWELREDYKGTALTALSPLRGKKDKFQENINVLVSEIPKDLDFELFFEANKKAIETTLPGTKRKQETGDIFANLLRGKYFSFENNIDQYQMKLMVAVWAKDGKVVVISTSAEKDQFDKYSPAFYKIMRSLRF